MLEVLTRRIRVLRCNGVLGEGTRLLMWRDASVEKNTWSSFRKLEQNDRNIQRFRTSEFRHWLTRIPLACKEVCGC